MNAAAKHPPHPLADAVTALLLAAALLLGGVLLSQQVTGSALYQQSRIIRSLVQTDNAPGLTRLATDARERQVLLNFAGALANAYVSFELIPTGELATFNAVYESLGSVVEIEEFTYHRRNLIITGTSPDQTGYQEFLRRLRATDHFASVSGHAYTTTDDAVRFSIECTAA